MTGSEQVALPGDPTPAARVRGLPPHVRLRLARAVATLAGGLAVAGVAVSLSPYRSQVAGVPVTISASVLPSYRGITVDSTVGNLAFRDVTSLPLGLHVAPRIDLRTVQVATSGGQEFSRRARADLAARAPALVAHFAGAALGGLLLGGLAGGLLFDGALQLVSARPELVLDGERRRRLRGTALRVVALTVLTAGTLAAVGVLTYRPSWYTRYTVSGLLADVAATPTQLASLDARDAAAAGKLRAVLRLQEALTQPPPTTTTPDAAYRILLISDVHRRDIYPYLQQYVDANDVALIVNTGDETLVGNRAELTPDFLSSIRAVTERTPMIWVKGNHDSRAVARSLDAVPGVTVLDGQVVQADGLQLYGVADPRDYGAAGDAGSDAPEVVTRLEAAAAGRALAAIDRRTFVDLLMAHEPVEADVIAGTLGTSVRAQASGHTHHQNAEDDLQRRGHDLRLVEGTTGLGGLFADAGDPLEFSILSVTADCQFTRIVRYALSDPALPAETQTASFGQSSSFGVHYFRPQAISPTRSCSRAAGVGEPVDARSSRPPTIAEWGLAADAPASPAPVVSPSPVRSADETGDARVGTPAPSVSGGPTAGR